MVYKVERANKDLLVLKVLLVYKVVLQEEVMVVKV